MSSPDVEVNVLFDKDKGTIKGVGIYNPQNFYIYNVFEVKNGLIIPASDLELKKANKAWEAISDIMGDLPEVKFQAKLARRIF